MGGRKTRPALKPALQNVLVVYKKSEYEHYLARLVAGPDKASGALSLSGLKELKRRHFRHFDCLRLVEDTLSAMNLPFCAAERGRMMDYAVYGLVITVGGDGTLLSAAQNVRDQLLLGVNSDSESSCGRLCPADASSFRDALRLCVDGRSEVLSLDRLQVLLEGEDTGFLALNDVLIAHPNPAIVSRYFLKVPSRGGEFQRSSGLWVSTAAGSTGAIASAGEKPLSLTAPQILYKPRELCRTLKNHYHLTGGPVKPPGEIHAEWLMDSGCIFVDGAHARIVLRFGSRIAIRRSSRPLRIIDYKGRLLRYPAA